MGDRDLRSLERRWRESGAEDDRQRWLQARSRATGLPLAVLESQDRLAERGLVWALERVEARVVEHATRQALRPALAALAVEAFGPLAPDVDGDMWYSVPHGDTVERRVGFARACLESADDYVRTLVRLCQGWVRDRELRVVGRELARITASATHAESAWYWEAGTAVSTFCELVGEPEPTEVEDLAEACFESWVLQDGQTTRFGDAVALGWVRQRFEARYGQTLPHGGYPPRDWIPLVPAGDAREALLPHLHTTLALDWARPPAEVAARLSGPAFRETGAFERYQAEVDDPAHGDDPTRTQRLARALQAARVLADGGGALGLAALTAVQAEVLGRSAPVRTQPALAKRGAETYAWWPHLERSLELKWAADLADGCHPVVQAARLYLDLLYTHPFEDGNARAARLALECVLRRGRLPTPELAPLERFPKPAGDAGAYWAFVGELADGIRSVST